MKKLLISLLALSIIPCAQAADSSDGCGIASEVYGDKTMVGITSRSTTRQLYSGTLDLTGTTSGKFGCAKHSIVKADKKSLHYLNANQDYVLAEAAIGGGEYLHGLARSLGCQDSVYGAFASSMQDNFLNVFKAHDSGQAQTLKNIKSVIKENQLLAAGCRPAV